MELRFVVNRQYLRWWAPRELRRRMFVPWPMVAFPEGLTSVAMMSALVVSVWASEGFVRARAPVWASAVTFCAPYPARAILRGGRAVQRLCVALCSPFSARRDADRLARASRRRRRPEGWRIRLGFSRTSSIRSRRRAGLRTDAATSSDRCSPRRKPLARYSLEYMPCEESTATRHLSVVGRSSRRGRVAAAMLGQTAVLSAVTLAPMHSHLPP
jgi:hypothetical protein